MTYLHELEVAAQHRRQGIGRQLMRAFATADRQRDASRMFLTTGGTNAPARALDDSLGGTLADGLAVRFPVPHRAAHRRRRPGPCPGDPPASRRPHRAPSRIGPAALRGGGGSRTGQRTRPGLKAVGPGDAALWDPGEEHDASSDEGLTAIRIEGELDVWAMGFTKDIVVSDYEPAWPDWFATAHGHLWPAVEDVALRIDHVGSTAVPGLAAKPIIDMDIVVGR